LQPVLCVVEANALGHGRDGVFETLPEGAGSREAPGQILANSGKRLREPALAGP